MPVLGREAPGPLGPPRPLAGAGSAVGRAVGGTACSSMEKGTGGARARGARGAEAEEGNILARLEVAFLGEGLGAVQAHDGKKVGEM